MQNIFTNEAAFGNLSLKVINNEKVIVEGDQGGTVILEKGKEYFIVRNVVNNGPVIYSEKFWGKDDTTNERLLFGEDYGAVSSHIQGMCAIGLIN